MRKLPKPWRAPTLLWTPPSSIMRMLSPPSGATRDPLPHLSSNQSQCSTTHTHLPYQSSNQSHTSPSPNHSTQPTIATPHVYITHLVLHIELSQGCSLHQSGQQHKSHPQTRRGTHLGSRDGHQARSLRREERGMDFRKATEVIRQVITFAQSLPHVMNNHRNMERWIWQCETRRAKPGTSTTSLSHGHSPIPQPPKALPPPGVSAYHPPMLRDPPLHLDSDVAPKDSMAFTLSAHRVDSHCKAAKPSRDISCTDSSTQVISRSYCEAAVGPDLDLSQENSKIFKTIPENSEKNSGNSQSTSYGDILDPTLHTLALALPLCPVREETLLKAIYLEDWNDFTLDGLLPAQRLAYNLLFEILTPYRPGHLGQLGHHSLPFNMFVHWHLRWNAIPECRKENPAGRHYLTGPEF